MKTSTLNTKENFKEALKELGNLNSSKNTKKLTEKEAYHQMAMILDNVRQRVESKEDVAVNAYKEHQRYFLSWCSDVINYRKETKQSAFEQLPQYRLVYKTLGKGKEDNLDLWGVSSDFGSGRVPKEENPVLVWYNIDEEKGEVTFFGNLIQAERILCNNKRNREPKNSQFRTEVFYESSNKTFVVSKGLSQTSLIAQSLPKALGLSSASTTPAHSTTPSPSSSVASSTHSTPSSSSSPLK